MNKLKGKKNQNKLLSYNTKLATLKYTNFFTWYEQSSGAKNKRSQYRVKLKLLLQKYTKIITQYTQAGGQKISKGVTSM